MNTGRTKAGALRKTIGWSAGLLVGSLTIGIGTVCLPLRIDPLFWAAMAAPGAALAAATASAGRLSLISPGTLFAVLYVVFTHVGALLFYREAPSRNANFLLMSSVTLAAFAMGIAAPMVVAGRGRLRRIVRRLPPARNDLIRERRLLWSAFGTLGALGSLLFLVEGIRRTGSFPIISLVRGGFSGNVRSLADARFAFSGGPAQGYLYNIYAVMLPAAALAFVLAYAATRQRKYLWPGICLSILAVLAATAGAYRASLMLLAVLVCVAVSYYRGSIWSRATRRVTLAALVVLGMISAAGYSDSSAEISTTDAVVTRVFKVQALGPQFVYESLSRSRDVSRGRDLVHDIRGVLPGRQIGLSSALPAARGVKSLNNPVGIPAELYLNFGPYGLAAAMFLFGTGCHCLHKVLLRWRGVGQVALAAVLTTAVGYGALAGVVGALFQFGAVTAALMALTLRIGNGRSSSSQVSARSTTSGLVVRIPERVTPHALR